MPKPLVDSMEGLSPAVAIEQKNPTTSSRSTVGTATEINDCLRLLWARAGTQTCLQCGRDVKRDTVQEVVDAVMNGAGNRDGVGARGIDVGAQHAAPQHTLMPTIQSLLHSRCHNPPNAPTSKSRRNCGRPDLSGLK